jgi:hypothetical protein
VCAAPQPGTQEPVAVKYDNLLLALLDNSPYLTDGSKQAVSTAAALASLTKGKVTVLLLDQEVQADEATHTRLETVRWHFEQQGFEDFECLEKLTESSAVAIGDMADQMKADLAVLSTEAIHAKHVDANLLAEFVPCPVLLLP